MSWTTAKRSPAAYAFGVTTPSWAFASVASSSACLPRAAKSASSAAELRIVERWKELLLGKLADLVASVLAEYLDQLKASRVAQRLSKPNGLSPLVVDSLKPERLALVVRVWQPAANAAAT